MIVYEKEWVLAYFFSFGTANQIVGSQAGGR